MTWQHFKTEVYTHRTHLKSWGLIFVLWLFLIIGPPFFMFQPDSPFWGRVAWIVLMLLFGAMSAFTFIGTYNKEVDATVWADFGTNTRAVAACMFCEKHKIPYNRGKATTEEEQLKQTRVGFLNEDDLVLVRMSV